MLALTQTKTRPVASVEAPAVDVCILVEGCYPYIAGGVSSWLNWLIRSQPHLNFAVLAIVSGAGPRVPRYERPPNLVFFDEVNLNDPTVLSRRGAMMSARAMSLGSELADAGADLFSGGGARALEHLLEVIKSSEGETFTLEELVNSALAWETVQHMYRRLVPQASFLQFFWAWRSLLGGLFRVATCPLPRARAYHAISTGYAGLLAARSQIETGAPALITEHGIYTNERRIDILLADWISDTIEKGVVLDTPRLDVRDIWVSAFEAYARCAYDSASFITTLYRENQILQRLHGAESDKLRVIPNGIDISQFEGIEKAGPDDRPTVALIGRVVPIKDVKTFIHAVAILRRRFPDIEALVMGSTDEDEAYYEECRALVSGLDLEDCVTFTGNVRIVDYFPRIHVVVLTSLSEAQPLVLLEAGAAGIPCVTTNVGCCKELIEGAPDEMPPLGRGGFVTDAVSPEQTAFALAHLLSDHSKLEAFGAVLQERTKRSYTSPQSSERYRALYEEAFARVCPISTEGAC